MMNSRAPSRRGAAPRTQPRLVSGRAARPKSGLLRRVGQVSKPSVPRWSPTGLVVALWLTKLGVEVRIVDKTAEPSTTSRALAVQALTLELYRQLDLTDAVAAQHQTRRASRFPRP